MEKIIATCPMCDKRYKIALTPEQNRRFSHRGNALIQEILPELNAVEREFLISGYCPHCQEMLFCSGVKTDKITLA